MTSSIHICRRECCIHNSTFRLINYCSGRPPERWNASSWGPDFTLINFILIIIINYFSAQAAAPKGEMKFNYEMDCILSKSQNSHCWSPARSLNSGILYVEFPKARIHKHQAFPLIHTCPWCLFGADAGTKFEFWNLESWIWKALLGGRSWLNFEFWLTNRSD